MKQDIPKFVCRLLVVSILVIPNLAASNEREQCSKQCQVAGEQCLNDTPRERWHDECWPKFRDCEHQCDQIIEKPPKPNERDDFIACAEAHGATPKFRECLSGLQPRCMALSSIEPQAAGKRANGAICGLSCGQLKSIYEYQQHLCKNVHANYCDDDLDEYYRSEIPKCCTGGVPLCQ